MSEQPPTEQSENQEQREPWWSYALDIVGWFGEVIAWMVGGVFRIFAWMCALVLEGCS